MRFFRAFSLLCFTDCGDHSTREETGLHMLEHSLVSAMLDNNTGTSLPLSTQDFHQVSNVLQGVKQKEQYVLFTKSCFSEV